MLDCLRGKFLIAGKNLRDPNFFKTVVLMVEHGEQGAMGLVINRPSSVGVSHALSEHFNLPTMEDLVFVGGPVEPSALFIIHNDGVLDTSEREVVPDVFVGSSPSVFESIVAQVADGDHSLRFRIFSGCAGWGPGQLESEMARGDWHIIDATSLLTFHEDPYDMWDDAMRTFQQFHQLLPVRANPEWN